MVFTKLFTLIIAILIVGVRCRERNVFILGHYFAVKVLLQKSRWFSFSTNCLIVVDLNALDNYFVKKTFITWTI
jgi:hypothetical protein